MNAETIRINRNFKMQRLFANRVKYPTYMILSNEGNLLHVFSGKHARKDCYMKWNKSYGTPKQKVSRI